VDFGEFAAATFSDDWLGGLLEEVWARENVAQRDQGVTVTPCSPPR
jgi:hypothetical protein